MNESKFKDDIKNTFESQVPDVLHQIKASPKFAVPKRNHLLSRWIVKPNKAVVSLFSIFVVVLIVLFSIRQLRDPVAASTVTLDINPSIVITLDEDDNVISVSTVNNDGETVIEKNIRYRGLSIEEFVDILVRRLEALGYIVTTDAETNIILIEVDAENTTIRNRVETAFKTRLNTKMEEFGAPHWVLNSREIRLVEQHDELRDRMIVERYTRAKLTLVYRILELDDSYTKEDLIELTVRQLYNLYINLEDPENLPDPDQMPGRHMPPGMPHSNANPCICIA